MNQVVITGLGCVSAAGAGIESIWARLKNGQSMIGPITRFDTQLYRSRIGAEVKFDEELSSLVGFNMASLSRNSRLAVAAAHEALHDSALLSAPSFKASRTGICLGSGLGGLYFSEEALTTLMTIGIRGISPMSVPFVDPNSIVNQIAIRWGLTGRQSTISTACSSSAHAIGAAFDLIRSGRCDAVLTGGVEATISPLIFAGFDRLRAMSAKNETPDIACRPFSDDRDGFVMAEGAAILVLENEASARARNANVYARILGYGATGGAHHPVMPRPGGEDLTRAMQDALADSALAPSDIDLINPHGTGTRLNDDAELTAMQTVFGEHLQNISVTPTKQLTGHMLGAAGALESLHVVKSIHESCITPIRYWESSAALNIQTATPQARKIRFAMNNSFGFGNNNASLVFGAHE